MVANVAKILPKGPEIERFSRDDRTSGLIFATRNPYKSLYNQSVTRFPRRH